MNTRRSFLQKSIFGISALAASNLSFMNAYGNSTSSSLEREETFKLGVAGYSFLHFDLEKSLAMLRRMEINYLCIKDFHLPLDSTENDIKAFHETLSKSNVKGYAVGPLYMKTKEEIDKAFDYARKVGVDLIVGIPQPNDLDYISSKAKEYAIRYAIHNHGPEDKLYPNIGVIYDYVKDLDPRVGVCLDIGHNTRDQQNLVSDIEKYHTRIFDIHLKNVTHASAEGKTCELGRGVIDIPLFIKALKKVNYKGICAMEHEKDMKDPLAGLAESAGYYRGVLDVIS